MRNLGSHQRYSALSIDCPAKFLVPQLMAGVQLQFQPDLERTELLLAIGVNTVVSHGHGVMVPNPLGHLRDLRARGGRVVVIDPRRSESARHADLHLAPRPGTDRVRRRPPRARGAAAAAATREFLGACADEASVRRLAAAVAPFDVETDRGDRRRARRRPAGARRARRRRRPGGDRDRHRRDDEPQRQPHRVAGVGARRRHRQPRPPRRRHVQPRLAAPLRGRRAGRAGRPRAAAGEPARPAAASSTARCRAPRWPTRSAPGTCGPCSCASATRRWPSPASPRCATRSPRSTLLVAIDVRPTETTAARHPRAADDRPLRARRPAQRLPAGRSRSCATPRRWSRRVGERRPQWWVFAELARRLGLPVFGSARRDAALAGRDVDDEAIAESIMAQRPAAVGRGAGHAARHPRRLGGAGLARARPPSRSASTSRPPSSSPSSTPPGRRPPLPDADAARADQPAHAAAVQLAAPRGRRPRPAGDALRCSCTPTTPPRAASPTATSPWSARPTGRAAPSSRSPTRSAPASCRSPTASATANVNRVISTADADPLSGMTIVSGLPVEVRRAADTAP